MKYKVTLNGRTYEVEVVADKAMCVAEYEAYAPAAAPVAAAPVAAPVAAAPAAAPAAAGVTAIIQPGGSIRDQEVIDAANEHNIAMVFTGCRVFRH